MHVRFIWNFLKTTNAQVLFFSPGLQIVSSEQLCLKTTGLFEDLLPLSNLLHFFYSTRRGSFSVHRSEKTPGSKYSSTSGLSPRGRLERQAEFHASTQDEA